MVLKSFFYTFLIVASTTSLLNADSWRMFLYMDASDRLSDMAWKNITDCMRGNPNDLVEVAIQLHAYNDVALRYTIDNGALRFIEEVTLTNDAQKNFIDAVSWAFTDNKSDHTMLIFANHGWGALDPQWNPVTEAWEAAEISMPHDGSGVVCSIAQLPKKSYGSWVERHKKHRAFMFDGITRTYLSNADMVAGLAYVQTNVLNNKKLDVIAFDTCMGCMAEIASYVAPYADYLVGVQSCASVDGFDYQGFVAALNKGNSARDTVAEFVTIFDAYYKVHDGDGIYTCTALDLGVMDEFTARLNGVVEKLLTHPTYIPLAKQARDDSPRFCLWPIYSDVVAFLKLVEHNLLQHYAIQDNDNILGALHDFYHVVNKMVVARCGGYTTEGKAYGLSIYLPYAVIDQSYVTSQFAKTSQWINLLNKICS